MRYAGLRLESALGSSSYWQDAPLARRAAVLLFLVDRGVVHRKRFDGRYVYEPTPDAETWVSSQPSLTPYLLPTLDLLGALRVDAALRTPSADAQS